MRRGIREWIVYGETGWVAWKRNWRTPDSPQGSGIMNLKADFIVLSINDVCPFLFLDRTFIVIAVPWVETSDDHHRWRPDMKLRMVSSGEEGGSSIRIGFGQWSDSGERTKQLITIKRPPSWPSRHQIGQKISLCRLRRG